MDAADRQRLDRAETDRERDNIRRRVHVDVETCVRAVPECPECMDAFGMKE